MGKTKVMAMAMAMVNLKMVLLRFVESRWFMI